MKRFVPPVLLLALLGAFASWWFSPGQIVKRRTETLLETLTLESGSGRVGRHLAAYSLNALLASQVELECPSIQRANGTFERAEMESAFSWLCDQAKQTRFDMKKFHSVKIQGDQAKVSFALAALVELPSYRPADGTYEVILQWRREDKVWHLTAAEWK